MSQQPTDSTPLKDRVILVTGPGQGLGRAAALAFAGAGATVLLLGRTTAKLEQVYDEIVTAGGPLPAIFPMDLGQAGDRDFESLAQGISYQLHRLDGILHCATAFENPSPLALQTSDAWRLQFQVNAVSPFALNRACEPLLRLAPDASVILVGETHGHMPTAYWGGFAVSKAALEAYFRVQRDEWAELPNLRINLVIPGPINSPQRQRSHPGEVKETLPTTEAVAQTLLRLMGPDGRQTRGQLIEWSPASA